MGLVATHTVVRVLGTVVGVHANTKRNIFQKGNTSYTAWQFAYVTYRKCQLADELGVSPKPCASAQSTLRPAQRALGACLDPPSHPGSSSLCIVCFINNSLIYPTLSENRGDVF